VTVLLLKRSILTEKLSRRGFHLSRDSVDPLEILFVREVMRTNVMALRARETVEEFAGRFRPDHSPRGQHLYPVLDEDPKLAGVITRKDLEKVLKRSHGSENALRRPRAASHTLPDRGLR
jgi:chloride channel protein, CIC family